MGSTPEICVICCDNATYPIECVDILCCLKKNKVPLYNYCKCSAKFHEECAYNYVLYRKVKKHPIPYQCPHCQTETLTISVNANTFEEAERTEHHEKKMNDIWKDIFNNLLYAYIKLFGCIFIPLCLGYDIYFTIENYDSQLLIWTIVNSCLLLFQVSVYTSYCDDTDLIYMFAVWSIMFPIKVIIICLYETDNLNIEIWQIVLINLLISQCVIILFILFSIYLLMELGFTLIKRWRQSIHQRPRTIRIDHMIQPITSNRNNEHKNNDYIMTMI